PGRVEVLITAGWERAKSEIVNVGPPPKADSKTSEDVHTCDDVESRGGVTVTELGVGVEKAINGIFRSGGPLEVHRLSPKDRDLVQGCPALLGVADQRGRLSEELSQAD